MGQIEILEKLEREFRKGIHEECQVVYVLSRIRKVLEIYNNQAQYKYLNFYCNWALHHKLDRSTTTALLLGLFEPEVDDSRSSKENAIKIKSRGNTFFKFSSLKFELDQFFQEYSLPFDLLNKNWKSFMNFTLEIIKECPVMFTSSKLQQLELVKDKNGIYCYKFTLIGCRQKPIIKLKLNSRGRSLA